MAKAKTLTAEQQQRFIVNRDRLKFEYERMRRTSDRPTYPDRRELWLKESETSA